MAVTLLKDSLLSMESHFFLIYTRQKHSQNNSIKNKVVVPKKDNRDLYTESK
jgi:hypothetical protein